MRHRREVVTRRTIYELRKARERAHVLEGLSVALANIDAMIRLIRRSPVRRTPGEGLMARVWEAGPVTAMLERAGAVSSRPEGLEAGLGLVGGGYRLSGAQAQAILDLRLHRLTGLEQDRIHGEYQGAARADRRPARHPRGADRLMQVIRDELVELRTQYADARRTEIQPRRST